MTSLTSGEPSVAMPATSAISQHNGESQDKICSLNALIQFGSIGIRYILRCLFLRDRLVCIHFNGRAKMYLVTTSQKK